MKRWLEWLVADRVVMADEMMMDNTETLERKIDKLADELRRLRDRLDR